MSNEDYTKLYLDMLDVSYVKCRDWWDDFLSADVLCLACYCKAHGFCHRYLLISFIEARCKERDIDFTYLGEIE